jgi:hypothetical protein
MGVRVNKPRHHHRTAGIDPNNTGAGLTIYIGCVPDCRYRSVSNEQGAGVDDPQIAHLGSDARARRPRKGNELRSVFDDEFNHLVDKATPASRDAAS